MWWTKTLSLSVLGPGIQVSGSVPGLGFGPRTRVQSQDSGSVPGLRSSPRSKGPVPELRSGATWTEPETPDRTWDPGPDLGPRTEPETRPPGPPQGCSRYNILGFGI